METIRVIGLTALPYILLGLVVWILPLWLSVGLIVFTLTLGLIWPLPMGEWVFRYWKRGQCRTPDTHRAALLPQEKIDTIATFYYPGLGGSWMQALRYAGKEGLPTSVQLWVGDQCMTPNASIANAPLLLHNLCPIDPPEVRTDIIGMLLYLYTSFATSADRVTQRVRMGDDYALAWPLVSFAQQGDIDQFLSTIRAVSDAPNMKQRRFVLAGSSRGASTVLGAVVNMTREERARIAFVLLEGAFDTVPHVAGSRYGVLGRVVPRLLSWLTRYDPAYPSPLALAARFPTDVPVLIVTSEADWHVPMANTLRVRDAIVKAREGDAERVHLLVLKHSHHSYYVNDHLDDQTAYRAVMETMHRLYC